MVRTASLRVEAAIGDHGVGVNRWSPALRLPSRRRAPQDARANHHHDKIDRAKDGDRFRNPNLINENGVPLSRPGRRRRRIP